MGVITRPGHAYAVGDMVVVTSGKRLWWLPWWQRPFVRLTVWLRVVAEPQSPAYRVIAVTPTTFRLSEEWYH